MTDKVPRTAKFCKNEIQANRIKLVLRPLGLKKANERVTCECQGNCSAAVAAVEAAIASSSFLVNLTNNCRMARGCLIGSDSGMTNRVNKRAVRVILMSKNTIDKIVSVTL